MKAAIIGGGVIGGGWAARFLLNGWDVAVFDPDPEAERKITAVMDNARNALAAENQRKNLAARPCHQQVESRGAYLICCGKLESHRGTVVVVKQRRDHSLRTKRGLGGHRGNNYPTRGK